MICASTVVAPGAIALNGIESWVREFAPMVKVGTSDTCTRELSGVKLTATLTGTPKSFVTVTGTFPVSDAI